MQEISLRILGKSSRALGKYLGSSMLPCKDMLLASWLFRFLALLLAEEHRPLGSLGSWLCLAAGVANVSLQPLLRSPTFGSAVAAWRVPVECCVSNDRAPDSPLYGG